ncbi:MAG: hypothetical protein JRG95_15210 [Deltaproteobacteria bacterium]|nr:hypothetical protein [Deltaproteobacteria bacterium]
MTALTYVLTIEDPERFAKSRTVGSYLGASWSNAPSGSWPADPSRISSTSESIWSSAEEKRPRRRPWSPWLANSRFSSTTSGEPAKSTNPSTSRRAPPEPEEKPTEPLSGDLRTPRPGDCEEWLGPRGRDRVTAAPLGGNPTCTGHLYCPQRVRMEAWRDDLRNLSTNQRLDTEGSLMEAIPPGL